MDKLLKFVEQYTTSQKYNDLMYGFITWFFGPGGSRIIAWFLLILGLYLFIRRRVYSYPALGGVYILSTIIAYSPNILRWLVNIFY